VIASTMEVAHIYWTCGSLRCVRLQPTEGSGSCLVLVMDDHEDRVIYGDSCEDVHDASLAAARLWDQFAAEPA